MSQASVSRFHFEGCDFAYRLTGSGPPVLFIQGVGVHGDGWAPQTAGLSSEFACLSFDNRGMGASQPFTGRLSVESMATDALALMSHVGWDSAHLVGHSLGGVIAQEIALRVPERVRSLTLMCTVARGADATRLSGRMLWLGIRSSIGTRRSRRRAFLEMVMPPAALAGEDPDRLANELEGLFGHDLAEQPPIAMKQLGALRAYDATPRLHELGGFPTLVMSAAFDPIAPPGRGRALANGIPGARFVLFDDSSHGLPIQHADRVNGLLREHLRAAESMRQGQLEASG